MENLGLEFADELLLAEEPLIGTSFLNEPHWSEKFKYDLYDWDNPAYKKLMRAPDGYQPVRMKHGYFFFVLNRDYVRMTQYRDGSPKKWVTKIDYWKGSDRVIQKVYARRVGRGKEPLGVYAHREVLKILKLERVGEHINGWGLDNRATNLVVASRKEQNTNTVRTSKFGLMPGVEVASTSHPDGRIRYRGKRCRRFVNGKVKTYRSKQVWLTQVPANRWYLNQIKKLFKGRKSWAHDRPSVDFPVFPPLKLTYRRERIDTSVYARDIPF